MHENYAIMIHLHPRSFSKQGRPAIIFKYPVVCCHVVSNISCHLSTAFHAKQKVNGKLQVENSEGDALHVLKESDVTNEGPLVLSLISNLTCRNQPK